MVDIVEHGTLLLHGVNHITFNFVPFRRMKKRGGKILIKSWKKIKEK
jgi:hypothetical protein